MKKTLIAIMALASFAVAETTLPEPVLSGTSDLTTPSTANSWSGISIALTLNVEVLETLAASSEQTDIVRTYGSTSQGQVSGGIGLALNSNGKIAGAWGNSAKYVSADAPQLTAEGFFTNLTSATVIFAYAGVNPAVDGNAVLTLSYTDKGIVQYEYQLTGLKSSQWTVLSDKTVDINTDLVTYVNVYSSKLSTDDAKAIGVAMIPEPTTATLSLLALAGLAARRRRK